MRRRSFELDDTEEAALNALLAAESPEELLTLFEGNDLYSDPSFSRKIISISRNTPENPPQYAFYFLNLHEKIHRELNRAAPTQAACVTVASSRPSMLPESLATIIELLGEKIPFDPGVPRLASNLSGIQEDLEALGISVDRPIPQYFSRGSLAWNIVVVKCVSCEREQAVARMHFIDIVAIHDIFISDLRSATGTQCRYCACEHVVPRFVWIDDDDASCGDLLGALSTLLIADDKFVFKPPATGYERSIHGRLLEERCMALVHAVRPSRLPQTFVITYSDEEFEHGSFEPLDPFDVAATTVAVALEEPHIEIADAETLAKRLVETLNLTQPCLVPPIDARPWFPLAAALVNEAIVIRCSLDHTCRLLVAVHTASCLTALRKLEAARIAIDRASSALREVPSDHPERSELSDYIDMARGDLLTRQERTEEGAVRLKVPLAAPLDGTVQQRVAHWIGRTMEALYFKQSGDYDAALRGFGLALPKLRAQIEELGANGMDVESAIFSFSAALANTAGVLLELVNTSLADAEHLRIAKNTLHSIGLPATDIDHTVDVSLLTVADQLIQHALSYSLEFHHHEHIALQSERWSTILILAKKYDQVEKIMLSGLDAAILGRSHSCTARLALSLAWHNVPVKHVDNVLSMAKEASSAAAKLSIEENAYEEAIEFGVQACCCVLDVAIHADAEQRREIILLIESQKALRTADALQVRGARPMPSLDPALVRRQERLRAERQLLDEDENEIKFIDTELQDVRAKLAEQARVQMNNSEYRSRSLDAKTLELISAAQALDTLNRLGPRTTLLGMFEHDDRAWVYALWNGGAEICEIEDWAHMKANLRIFAESVASGGAASFMATDLLRPVAWQLADMCPSDRLVISPFGTFAGVPFDALNWDGAFLCERVTLSLTMGLGALASCLKRPFNTPLRVLVIGDPQRTTPQPPVQTREEVIQLDRMYRAAGWETTQLLGVEATPVRVKEAMPRNSVVHVACHGSDGTLLLSEDLAGTQSGVITPADLWESYVMVPGGLAVIAACESGRVDITFGHSDALVSGFLRAGASTVVVSRWLVNDMRARVFMQEFHSRLLSGMTAVEAHTNTVRAALHGDLGESFRTPASWAVFAVYGR